MNDFLRRRRISPLTRGRSLFACSTTWWHMSQRIDFQHGLLLRIGRDIRLKPVALLDKYTSHVIRLDRALIALVSNLVRGAS